MSEGILSVYGERYAIRGFVPIAHQWWKSKEKIDSQPSKLKGATKWFADAKVGESKHFDGNMSTDQPLRTIMRRKNRKASYQWSGTGYLVTIKK